MKDENGTKSIFLGAYGVPETFIIDKELNILRKYIGPINLENEIEIKNLVKWEKDYQNYFIFLFL